MYSGKYLHLYNYLIGNKEVLSLSLSFSEVEKILQFKLPNSAYKYSAWWANEAEGNHSHARSWLYAGWKTSNIELGKQVTFNKEDTKQCMIAKDEDKFLNQFKIAHSHNECTHFFIEEEDKEKLSILNLVNRKVYTLYYDNEEDDYYVVSEDGVYCYSVDAVVHVKMLRQIENGGC